MPMIDVEDRVRLHVQDLGSGPAVVFISGFGLDHALWDRQVRVLTGAGYRTVCVTQRGHGHSDHPLDGYGIDRLRDDLVIVLETLGINAATVVGHSFGGRVAFHTAATAPHLVAKLVLVGSNAVRATRSEEFPFGTPPEPTVARMVGDEETDRVAARCRLLQSSFAREQHPRVIDWLLQTWMQMPSWSAIACYDTLLRTDLIDEIELVRQPVLQLNGKADPVHSAKGGYWLQSRLNDTRMVELDCGHFPMLEAPDEFDDALRAFV
ncbi:alpha/beta hydrolase [Mycolicibacterium moriokaense]|uniref:3-oxoadipate enol-lactonase n=1 Tax=Mycolicibacterium moriokaense TaxID=39691 RepID=A0AAD1M5A6_9MYCO|nr:alpha/beta hydrolase [Mycolicibacterium moriokaense]MCV7039186.1 alpha/beta hydrolase [Mycolicibacterium moriokaense]ORB18532.1 alpha/beta hydrolase [Mycolicibacterium moriokaense]BBX00090.1 3-oxoadipate enol-lactonase [Mycolicibacterium moriokaense]